MKPTRVVNIAKGEPYDVYIGRSCKNSDGYFGNPFVIGQNGDRADVIKKFERYFAERIGSDPEYRHRVLELQGKRLGCYCKPLACHGDIIAEWVDLVAFISEGDQDE